MYVCVYVYVCGLGISVKVLICTKQKQPDCKKVQGESEAALYMVISNQIRTLISSKAKIPKKLKHLSFYLN